MRVRIYYEKRGGACFVPHVSLAQVFTRSAFRAGLNFKMTQGFSPHPKISFGPELPAGVVALKEPLDIYLKLDNNLENNINIEKWNAAMPEGFKILSFEIIDDNAPALGKICREAFYWIRGAENFFNKNLFESLKLYYGEDILDLKTEIDASDDDLDNNKWLAVLLNAPAKNGIGGFVKKIIADGVIAGWQDINIVRIAIGILSEK